MNGKCLQHGTTIVTLLRIEQKWNHLQRQGLIYACSRCSPIEWTVVTG